MRITYQDLLLKVARYLLEVRNEKPKNRKEIKVALDLPNQYSAGMLMEVLKTLHTLGVIGLVYDPRDKVVRYKGIPYNSPMLKSIKEIEKKDLPLEEVVLEEVKNE